MFKKLLVALLLVPAVVLADAPIIWSGSKAKWLPSGLLSSGVTVANSQGVVSQLSGGTSGNLLQWNGASWQPATNTAITSLTGEASASGPGAATVTLSNGAVIGKVLTGYTAGAGTITASDSILTAIQKNAGNVSALSTAPTSLGVYGSSPNTKGATLASNVLNLEYATASFPGSLSTGTQQIAGTKEFINSVIIDGNFTIPTTVNNSLSGANQRIPSHVTGNITFTNASLTSIGSANNGGVADGHRLGVCNETGAQITITHNYSGASAGEAIFSSTNADYLLANKACVLLQYSGNSSIWEMMDGGVVNLAGGGVVGVLPILSGGTNQTTFPLSGGIYFDGTRLVGNATNFVVYDGAGHTGYGGVPNASYTSAFYNNFLFSGNGVNSYNGTASTPAMWYSGSPYAAGTATTNKPELLLEDSGNTSTEWSTAGTYLGINGKSTFTGNLLDIQKNGTRQLTVANGGKFIYKMPANNTDEFCLEASGSTTQYCQGMNGGDLFWDQGANVFMYVHGGWISWSQTGTTPLYTQDLNWSATSTNVSTDLVRNSGTYNLPIYMARNSSSTVNDYSGFAFAGASTASTAVDAAVLAIHEVHTNGSETAHLSHYIRNAGGTLTDRLTIAKTGQLTASYYGAGVMRTDSSGNITSAALANSDLPAPSANTISSTAIDWSTVGAGAGIYTKTLAANTTFTFSNAVAGQTIVVVLTNTASNYTVTWPGTVKWSGGVTPVMTTGAKKDVYTFVYDGTDYLGSAVQNF